MGKESAIATAQQAALLEAFQAFSASDMAYHQMQLEGQKAIDAAPFLKRHAYASNWEAVEENAHSGGKWSEKLEIMSNLGMVHDSVAITRSTLAMLERDQRYTEFRSAMRAYYGSNQEPFIDYISNSITHTNRKEGQKEPATPADVHIMVKGEKKPFSKLFPDRLPPKKPAHPAECGCPLTETTGTLGLDTSLTAAAGATPITPVVLTSAPNPDHFVPTRIPQVSDQPVSARS